MGLINALVYVFAAIGFLVVAAGFVLTILGVVMFHGQDTPPY